jgi:hypothetical protein
MESKYVIALEEAIEQEIRLLELYTMQGDWYNVVLQKEYLKGLRQALSLITEEKEQVL